ncbi:hypothetical protein Tco_0216923 [Tanacetum coccineum]
MHSTAVSWLAYVSSLTSLVRIMLKGIIPSTPRQQPRQLPRGATWHAIDWRSPLYDRNVDPVDPVVGPSLVNVHLGDHQQSQSLANLKLCHLVDL